MGTWGTGLFSDDVASDVRDECRTLVGDGKDGATATDALLQTWAGELSDPDVMPVFWSALADTQWKAGRLEERVKVAALRVVSDGSDLSRWDDNPESQSEAGGGPSEASDAAGPSAAGAQAASKTVPKYV